MEVTKVLLIFALLFALVSCSNTPEFETGEIQTLQLIKEALIQKSNKKVNIDSRNLLSRSQIDEVAIPIIFVELETGQNGTLTLYPGQAPEKVWLGADGATITTNQGILKASRGMGDDLMGSVSEMPTWSMIKNKEINYNKLLSYLSGNNKIYSLKLECKIKKIDSKKSIEVWGAFFVVEEYQELCTSDKIEIKNSYYLDKHNTVRRSNQYHSETLGYVTTERLDRWPD